MAFLGSPQVKSVASTDTSVVKEMFSDPATVLTLLGAVAPRITTGMNYNGTPRYIDPGLALRALGQAYGSTQQQKNITDTLQNYAQTVKPESYASWLGQTEAAGPTEESWLAPELSTAGSTPIPATPLTEQAQRAAGTRTPNLAAFLSGLSRQQLRSVLQPGPFHPLVQGAGAVGSTFFPAFEGLQRTGLYEENQQRLGLLNRIGARLKQNPSDQEALTALATLQPHLSLKAGDLPYGLQDAQARAAVYDMFKRIVGEPAAKQMATVGDPARLASFPLKQAQAQQQLESLKKMGAITDPEAIATLQKSADLGDETMFQNLTQDTVKNNEYGKFVKDNQVYYGRWLVGMPVGVSSVSIDVNGRVQIKEDRANLDRLLMNPTSRPFIKDIMDREQKARTDYVALMQREFENLVQVRGLKVSEANAEFNKMFRLDQQAMTAATLAEQIYKNAEAFTQRPEILMGADPKLDPKDPNKLKYLQAQQALRDARRNRDRQYVSWFFRHDPGEALLSETRSFDRNIALIDPTQPGAKAKLDALATDLQESISLWKRAPGGQRAAEGYEKRIKDLLGQIEKAGVQQRGAVTPMESSFGIIESPYEGVPPTRKHPLTTGPILRPSPPNEYPEDYGRPPSWVPWTPFQPTISLPQR